MTIAALAVLEKSVGAAAPGELHGAVIPLRFFHVASLSFQACRTRRNSKIESTPSCGTFVTVNVNATVVISEWGGIRPIKSNFISPRFFGVPAVGPWVPIMISMALPKFESRNCSESRVSATGRNVIKSAINAKGAATDANQAAVLSADENGMRNTSC